MRNFMLVLVVFLALNQHSVFAADDHGNTFATATLISPTSSTAGVIDSVVDIDLFQLNLPEAGKLTFTVSGANNSFDGVLFDSYGNIMAGGLLSLPDGTSFYIDKLLVAGTYFIEVNSQFGGNKDYSLASDFQAVIEHGNSIATSTVVPPFGCTVTDYITFGLIDNYQDIDFFQINVEAEGTISVSTLDYPYVYGDIVDSSGSSLSINGPINLSENLLADVSPGIYYLRVDAGSTNLYELQFYFFVGEECLDSNSTLCLMREPPMFVFFGLTIILLAIGFIIRE